MSHLVILETSQFLRRTLWLGLAEDPTTAAAIGNETNIVLSNPGLPLKPNVVRRMSLWLYQITLNEHLRNGPYVRTDDDSRLRYPPLGLNLSYLLTPSTGSDEADQLVLGRSLQVLHDQSVLPMPSIQSQGDGEELHIYLAQRTIEELAEVWEAMQQPYRLSVCYEVRVVRIRSERELGAGRVTERVSDFDPVGAGA